MAKQGNPKYTFNPFKGSSVPQSNKEDAKSAIKQFVLESVLSYVGEGKSPVSGNGWKKSLAKDYLKYKKEFSSAGFANMELHGDMLDALDVVDDGDNLTLLVDDESQAGKSDGHNQHYDRPFEGFPKRRFIPKNKDGETFKREIESGIKDIISEFETNE